MKYGGQKTTEVSSLFLFLLWVLGIKLGCPAYTASTAIPWLTSLPMLSCLLSTLRKALRPPAVSLFTVCVTQVLTMQFWLAYNPLQTIVLGLNSTQINFPMSPGIKGTHYHMGSSVSFIVLYFIMLAFWYKAGSDADWYRHSERGRSVQWWP